MRWRRPVRRLQFRQRPLGWRRSSGRLPPSAIRPEPKGQGYVKPHDGIRRLGALGLCSLALAGCTTAPRLDTPPAAALDASPAGFSRPIRADVLNRAFFEAN